MVSEPGSCVFSSIVTIKLHHNTLGIYRKKHVFDSVLKPPIVELSDTKQLACEASYWACIDFFFLKSSTGRVEFFLTFCGNQVRTVIANWLNYVTGPPLVLGSRITANLFILGCVRNGPFSTVNFAHLTQAHVTNVLRRTHSYSLQQPTIGSVKIPFKSSYIA